MQDEEDEDADYFFSGFTWEAVVIGYGSGVVVGFAVGYIMFRTRDPKWITGIIVRKIGLKPLSIKCERGTNEMQEEEDEGDDYFFNGFTWEAVVIGYGSGVVLGFVVGYIMFMVGKPKWFMGIIARELGLKVRRLEIKRFA
ncbi:hypothetical protein ACET3Z_012274 [Daucus carota]